MLDGSCRLIAGPWLLGQTDAETINDISLLLCISPMLRIGQKWILFSPDNYPCSIPGGG